MEKDGWVYLFAALDMCCRGAKSTYKTVVGRAQSMDGPFLDKKGVPMTEGGGTPLTVSGPRQRGPGHPGLASAGGKGDFLAVHAYDAEQNGFPTLRLLPITWKRGWPEVPPLERSAAGGDIAGVWEHRAGKGAAQQLTLLEGGVVETFAPRGNRPAPQVTWERGGKDSFTLRWPDSSAPGGFWLDTCRLGRDKKTYSGQNQRGQKIHGVRVA